MIRRRILSDAIIIMIIIIYIYTGRLGQLAQKLLSVKSIVG